MTLRSLIAAAALLALTPALASAQDGSDSGWWVVLGSFELGPDHEPTRTVEDAVERVASAANRCGFTTFNDFSVKFEGFTGGYEVVVLGAYSTRAEADAVVQSVSKCVPGGYVKRARYLGE